VAVRLPGAPGSSGTGFRRARISPAPLRARSSLPGLRQAATRGRRRRRPGPAGTPARELRSPSWPPRICGMSGHSCTETRHELFTRRRVQSTRLIAGNCVDVASRASDDAESARAAGPGRPPPPARVVRLTQAGSDDRARRGAGEMRALPEAGPARCPRRPGSLTATLP